jgi:phosphate transport system substrate-binding protein
MKKILFTVIVSGLIASSIFIESCSNRKGKTNAKGNLSGQISLSGAFALYPLAVKWAQDFEKLHPDVKIDVSAGGAGKGITDALTDAVDLGMVSREVAPEEKTKGAVAFAVAKDAVVPTINARNPEINLLLQKGLKKEQAQGLWIKGNIKTWGEISGNSAKNGVHVYTRSDACGAAETWAKWLGKKQEDLKGTAVFGDPGVAKAVQDDKLGIGLNNISYVYNEKTGKPNPGIKVIPIDVNNNGKIDPEESFYDTKAAFIQAVAKGKYPSPPARDLYLVAHKTPTKPEVIAFIKYILTEGQKLNEPLGYISLSKDKLQAGLKLLK